MHNLEKLKIVELGNTGVGKTTYMASMYGALKKEIKGFSLEAIDSSVDRELCRLEEEIKSGSYPPPTSESYKSYNFYLRHKGERALSFDWYDYRGAALRERRLQSSDAESLQSDLRQADGIIVFCDCYSLSIRERKCISDIGRITNLLSDSLLELDRSISLAIMFTKVDLVNTFRPDLLDPLKGLMDCVALNPKVSGALIPVSCGRKMINVQLPLLFALQAGVRFKVSSLQSAIESHNQLAEDYSSKAQDYRVKSSGLGGWVRDAWKEHVEGSIPYSRLADYRYSDAQRERERAQEKLKAYEPLVGPADALDRYLKSTPRIQSEKTLKEYTRQLSDIRYGVLGRLLSRLIS